MLYLRTYHFKLFLDGISIKLTLSLSSVHEILPPNICSESQYNISIGLLIFKMPPCNINATKEVVDANVTPSTASGKLQLNDIRKALPAEVFVKSDVKAVGYMIFDYVLWFGTVACMQLFCNSDLWKSMPLYQQIMASVVYFNVAGFFMWCVFMIGHDAGHGTFSDSTLVNDVIGHIAHGSLLVPFFPWQVSSKVYCQLNFNLICPKRLIPILPM